MNDAGHVTAEEITVIEGRAKRTPDVDLSYSQVFKPKLLSNPDAETGSYIILTDSGSANIVRRGSRYNKLKINGSKVSYVVEEVGIEYEVNKADIRQAKSIGRPLNLEYVDRAIRACHEKINTLVYRGDTEFGEFPGLLELAGVTTYTGTDLDTSNLSLFDEFVLAMNSIPAKFRSRSYYLVLADKEYKKFLKQGNQYTQQTWKNMIESNYSNVKVIMDDELVSGASLSGGGTIATGTALLIPSDEQLCRIPMGYPVKSVVNKATVSDSYHKSILGRAEARMGPVEVPFPTAVCKITGWDA